MFTGKLGVKTPQLHQNDGMNDRHHMAGSGLDRLSLPGNDYSSASMCCVLFDYTKEFFLSQSVLCAAGSLTASPHIANIQNCAAAEDVSIFMLFRRSFDFIIQTLYYSYPCWAQSCFFSSLYFGGKIA